MKNEEEKEEGMKKKLEKIDKLDIIFAIIFLVAVFIRVWQFGKIPGGINQDEAFSGYEAYSLLNYGKDSSGYANPVYFEAWGSGMNALNSYLMMPFIAIFGLKVWAIRIPQCIVACLTILAVFLLVNEMFNKKLAVICSGLLAIAPWHIMLSRWGLESNMAPGFLIFGLYFFVKGLKNARWMYVSALMYGLSLYCYATIWPFVPIMLLMQVGYCIKHKKIKIQKETIISVAIIFALALPLMLFMLVNYNVIGEIKNSFFSIPKLQCARLGEISFHNIGKNLEKMFEIIVLQCDGLPLNSILGHGIFYYCTLPFFVVGLYIIIKEAVKNRKSEFKYEIILLIQLVMGIFLGTLIYVNVNRINCIYIPIIIISGIGIYKFCEGARKKVLLGISIMYIGFFAVFSCYYFNDYQKEISSFFYEGVGNAIDEAQEHEGTVYISDIVSYSVVLFYSNENVNEFLDTVKYKNYPDKYLETKSFGRYEFIEEPENIEDNGIYIFSKKKKKFFEKKGYNVKEYKNYIIAYK